jgi:hypothetical protein
VFISDERYDLLCVLNWGVLAICMYECAELFGILDLSSLSINFVENVELNMCIGKGMVL